MSHPRHIWSGDWRSESERAREAAEQAERLKLERAARPEPASIPPRAADTGFDDGDLGEPPERRLPRSSTLAVVVLAISGLIAGAFALGTLTSGSDNGPSPLAAVSNSPIKPKKGQTQASAIYAAASPAVVSIRTGSGSGTGFLIDNTGTIVTNAHVAGRNKHVAVRFGQDGTSLDGRVKGTDPSSDLAVVLIDTAGIPKGVKPLQLADSRSVQVGDTAIAIGNPFGLDRTATEGIVSGLGREIRAPNGFQIDSVIQTDAPINPGNSGGPLLDDSGHVIGVNSQIATAGSGGNVGVGFAVPSNTVRQVIPQLEQGKVVKHAYLGVQTSAPTPGKPDGAEVQSIVPGGPAEKANMRTGDVITKIDGQDVKDPAAVSAAVNQKLPGDKITIQVERNGLTQDLTATLGNRPGRTP
jgi:putative serine protease PepD